MDSGIFWNVLVAGITFIFSLCGIAVAAGIFKKTLENHNEKIKKLMGKVEHFEVENVKNQFEIEAIKKESLKVETNHKELRNDFAEVKDEIRQIRNDCKNYQNIIIQVLQPILSYIKNDTEHSDGMGSIIDGSMTRLNNFISTTNGKDK